MADGNDSLFDLLNPQPPQGFFGNVGAGIQSGLGTLGVSAAQNLPELLMSDEADLADIGVGSFLSALGLPIAQRQRQEEQQREQARAILPQLFPLLPFEEQQRAATALVGRPVELQQPLLTPEERAVNEEIARLGLDTLEQKKAVLITTLTSIFDDPERAREKADELISAEAVASERARLERGERLGELQVKAAEVDIEASRQQIAESKASIAQAASEFKFEVEQSKVDAFGQLMENESLDFLTRTQMGIEHLKGLGFDDARAEETMGAAFAPQMRLQAEELIFNKLVLGKIPFEEWSDAEKQIARIGGFEKITEEDIARIRTSSGKWKFLKDQLLAGQLMSALEQLEKARIGSPPDESDEDALRRLLGAETAETPINILREHGIFAKEELDLKTLASLMSDLGSAASSLDVMLQPERVASMLAVQDFVSGILTERLMRKHGVKPGEQATDEQSEAVWRSSPELTMKRIKALYVGMDPATRPEFDDLDEILEQASVMVGLDVSNSPEWIKEAVQIQEVVIPQIPPPMRMKFARIDAVAGIGMARLERRFRRMYSELFTIPERPPSKQAVASELLRQIEEQIRARVPGVPARVPVGAFGNVADVPLRVQLPSLPFETIEPPPQTQAPGAAPPVLSPLAPLGSP